MDSTKEKLEQFQCENCGGTVKWNIARQRMECVSCKVVKVLDNEDTDIYKHDFKEYNPNAEVELPDVSILRCNVCGAELEFDSDDTAKVCPLCGATNVWTGRHVAGAAPDALIPFQVDKQDAQRLFQTWVKKRWFAPNKLKEAYQQGKLEGMYVPFWTFDAEAYAKYVGRGGKEYSGTDGEGNDTTRIKWTSVAGDVRENFEDMQIVAAVSQVSEIIDRVLPYNVEDSLVPFSSAYLSGFSAERYAITATDAMETARKKMQQEMENMAKKDIEHKGFDEAKIKKLDMELMSVQYLHTLFPAWFSTYAYGGKQYLYVINGQTGEVAGKRPYSIPKIAALVLVIIAIIAIFFAVTSNAAEKNAQVPQQQQYTIQQSEDGVEVMTEKE